MSMADGFRKKKGSFLIWGVLVVVVAMMFVLPKLKKPEVEKVVEPEKPVAVRTVAIELRTVEDSLRLPARVVPLQEAHLAAERAGRVIDLLADKGQSVEADQVLLRLDGRLWEAARQRAEIEERDASRDLKRWKELEKTGAVSGSEFESIQRRQESAKIALGEAEVMLSQCEVRSPFAGVIVARLVEVGDYANEGQAVLRVIRLDRVKLTFDVPEQDIGSLQVGQHKTFTLAVLAGREFTGEITFVSSQAERESNSFPVELTVENADGALKAGMIAQVDLVRRERKGAVVVPLAAIVPRKGEHYLFAVENGHAIRKRIQIAALMGHEAVLESGVGEGDQIVVEGHRGLQDGMVVSVVGPESVQQAPETVSAEIAH